METYCFTMDADQVDDYECECRNTATRGGFYPVDWEGQECEPVEGIWSELYRCARCGAYTYVDLDLDEKVEPIGNS